MNTKLFYLSSMRWFGVVWCDVVRCVMDRKKDVSASESLVIRSLFESRTPTSPSGVTLYGLVSCSTYLTLKSCRLGTNHSINILMYVFKFILTSAQRSSFQNRPWQTVVAVLRTLYRISETVNSHSVSISCKYFYLPVEWCKKNSLNPMY